MGQVFGCFFLRYLFAATIVMSVVYLLAVTLLAPMNDPTFDLIPEGVEGDLKLVNIATCSGEPALDVALATRQ